jgi:hypothetical protein
MAGQMMGDVRAGYFVALAGLVGNDYHLDRLRQLRLVNVAMRAIPNRIASSAPLISECPFASLLDAKRLCK